LNNDTTLATQTRPTTKLGKAGVYGWAVAALLALITLAAFLPALRNGFVNWDDQPNLLENPNYRGLSWSHLGWMFTTFRMGHYQPLSWMSFALDYLLWGMNPLGYHVTSLLLHAANAVIFYFLVYRLLALGISFAASDVRLRAAAAVAALFFAIHPLRVESVAWATERRDVLSAFFFLLTILFYLRSVKSNDAVSLDRRWLSAAVIVYLFSLLSKAGGAALPFVLLLLDFYPLRRLAPAPAKWLNSDGRRVLFEKVPFLILGLAAGVIALLAQHEARALRSIDQYGVAERVAQSLFALVFYLTKTIIPLDLSPLYEMPKELNPWAPPFVISGVVVIGLTTALFFARRRWPAGLAAWIFYILVVGPVLGIFQSGPQMAADRYTYLACMGWAVLLGAGLLYGWQIWSGMRMRVLIFSLVDGLVVAAVVALGFVTWKQTQIWHDSERLWKRALEIMPSGLAHFYLATALADMGRSDEAIEHFRQTLEIDPSHADSHYNLGKLLLRRGDLEESAAHLRRVVELNPKDAGAYNGLGLIAAQKGQLDEAIGYFRRALELNPSDGGTHNNLAIALAGRGSIKEAILHFRRALDVNPKDVATHSNLARALLQEGDIEGAVQHLRWALELNPRDAAIHGTLGMILARRGDLAEATRQFRSALEINSQDPAIHSNLAITLARQHDLQGAAKHFQEALRLQPDLAEAHAGLARVLAMQGKTDEAVRHYQQALQILKSQRQGSGAIEK